MNKLPVIDTHQHLWDTSRFSYSWLRDFPALDRPFLLSEYAEAAAGANVVKTVYVDTDVDECDMAGELAWILDLAARPDNALSGVVAGARPESEDFRAYIEKAVPNPLLKGVRRVLHTQPDDFSRQPLFRENLRSLAGYGLSFDLCVLARQLPAAIELVRAVPEVTCILDHCGVPDVKGQALDPWREHIAELASHPNVNCKISGVVAYADAENWTVDDLRPFVEHCLQCFGWERVLWASDWPVCTLSASWGRWFEAALAIVENESPENQRKLFHDNAERIYRL